MNFRVFQALALALFALCVGGDYSETETSPSRMCGKGCRPLEKGDFSEFFCIYRGKEERNAVYYGTCRNGAENSTEISKVPIKDHHFLLQKPLDKSVPLYLVPLSIAGEFIKYFACFLPEKAGICKQLSIVSSDMVEPMGGAFVSGTRIYADNRTRLTLSNDNTTLRKINQFDFVEKERVSSCFTPGTTCATDIDSLEIVEINKDVKSVYSRNDIFVYAECSKAICNYMLYDFQANTTYYIPKNLSVSSEKLEDFGEFLYLVPKIGFDDKFLNDKRRFKYSNIPEISVCKNIIFGPEFTAVKLNTCYLLPILMGITAALAFLLLVLIVGSIIIIVRNRRKLQESDRSGRLKTLNSLGLSLKTTKKTKATEKASTKEVNKATSASVVDENEDNGVDSNFDNQNKSYRSWN